LPESGGSAPKTYPSELAAPRKPDCEHSHSSLGDGVPDLRLSGNVGGPRRAGDPDPAATGSGALSTGPRGVGHTAVDAPQSPAGFPVQFRHA